MKKNIAMRVAAFLFILTMISTCAFATTFAKYTTNGTANDDARVAKWGVTVTAQKIDDLEYDITTSNEDGNITAIATEKTLAPGSKVNFACINLSGQPEVAVNVSYTATLTLTGWNIPKNGGGTEEYCPLVFKVDGKDYKIGGKALDDSDIKTIADLQKAVAAAIANYSKNFDRNHDLSLEDNLTVVCLWAFEGEDVKDTALGDAAATGTMPSVTLSITCTVTQID